MTELPEPTNVRNAPEYYAGWAWRSLAGYVCPNCRGDFHLKDDGTNVCKGCGLELVTEWEWQRRLNEASDEAERRYRFEEALDRAGDNPVDE